MHRNTTKQHASEASSEFLIYNETLLWICVEPVLGGSLLDKKRRQEHLYRRTKADISAAKEVLGMYFF